MQRSSFEIMAPVGSPESFAAALRAGADSIYFGIEHLNMRAHSASAFTIHDLRRIAEECRRCGVKSYLTVNTIIYDEDLSLMREILDAALEAGLTAVIASDIAVMTYCRKIGLEVHLSTQLNISNIEALRFYAQFADVVVLARELKLEQVAEIHRQIEEQRIYGPKGELIRIEMFCHGALCMAVSGKCYLSLDNTGRSANRGECMQLCRRGYTVRDRETGTELDIDNKYVMSPRDLKTIRFLDRMMEAGVRVFKIEGRARGAEYVDTVVRCYNEAIQAVLAGTFTEERKDEWDNRLARVFNRGFWDGYYLGQKLGEWNDQPGSRSTLRKVYVGKGVKYYNKLQVAEFKIEASPLNVGDKILITGPTTGALEDTVREIRYELKPVLTALQGQHISIPLNRKIRSSDKLFKLVTTCILLFFFILTAAARPRSLRRYGIPPGNYSGITSLGNGRYAVVSDKDSHPGFHLWSIRLNPKNGKVVEVINEGFRGTDIQTSRDAEGIAWCPQRGTIFISGEADQRIMEYHSNGTPTGHELPVPAEFGPERIKSNRGFEALCYDSLRQVFWTCLESPADEAADHVNLIQFPLPVMQAERYFPYPLSPSQARPGWRDHYHGVVALTSLADGSLLVLEREARITHSGSGSRCWVKLFRHQPATGQRIQLAEWKSRFNPLNTRFANYEGMCLGPVLRDGTQTLLLISDSQGGYGRGPWHLKDMLRVFRLPREQ